MGEKKSLERMCYVQEHGALHPFSCIKRGLRRAAFLFAVELTASISMTSCPHATMRRPAVIVAIYPRPLVPVAFSAANLQYRGHIYSDSRPYALDRTSSSQRDVQGKQSNPYPPKTQLSPRRLAASPPVSFLAPWKALQ